MQALEVNACIKGRTAGTVAAGAQRVRTKKLNEE
jgi:hypothetical protein